MSIPKPDGPDIDIGPSMVSLSWALYSLAGLVVVARVYTQLKVTRQFGIGDHFMIWAAIFGFTHIALLTVSHHYGLGRHFYYLDDVRRVKSMEWEFIAEPFGPLASMCGRTSFIILMFRLFGITPFRRGFLYFLIAETIVVNLVTCITIYTQCENVQTLWDPAGIPSKCWPGAVQADIGYFQGACNSLTDLSLTILPITIFFNLQMKIRLKVGLAALLGLSIFAFVSSIVKTVKLKTIGERSDYTFNTVLFMKWVVIENTFVIIGASIPLLRPLFSKAKQQVTTAYTASSAFEMNSRSQGNAKGGFSATQHKSIPLQSSSEENILPLQGAPSEAHSESKSGDEGGKDLEKGITKEVVVQVQYGKSGSAYPAANWDFKK